MDDTIIIGIASGIGVAIAAIYVRNKGKAIEPQIISVLQNEAELTASDIAEKIGLGNGWFAISRVIRALAPLVQRGALRSYVPENTPALQRIRATRYSLLK